MSNSARDSPSSSSAGTPPRERRAQSRRPSEEGAASRTRTVCPNAISPPLLQFYASKTTCAISSTRERPPGPYQKLAISSRTEHWRLDCAGERKAKLLELFGDLAHHALVHGGIAYHAALAYLATPRFELWLYQHTSPGIARLQRRHQRGQHQAQRDEREVRHGRAARFVEAELARVDPLVDHHARIGAQLRVQLAVAHVDRVHAHGPALEQDVGEPAGRGSQIDADAPGR